MTDAPPRYEVIVEVTVGGTTLDFEHLHDTDYGDLMLKLARWANQSSAQKDL